MGYLVGSGIIDPAIKRYNGGGSSFTMDNSGSTNGTLLWVGGVAQVPGTDYNVSGTTISTTSSTPSGTNNVVSLQLFNTGLITTPADNTVTTAKIQTNAIDGTLTKDALIADYSDVTITAADLLMYGDATDSNNTKRDTVQGVLDLVSSGPTFGTALATTSGSTFSFTGIPSGTKRIDIVMYRLSTSSNVSVDVQIGDSGGLETSGYTSQLASTQAGSENLFSQTNAFLFTDANNTYTHSGVMCLRLTDASNNEWVCFGLEDPQGLTGQNHFAGSKALSGELTQLQLLNFTGDAGRVNIIYD